jgi:hypothetical protein
MAYFYLTGKGAVDYLNTSWVNTGLTTNIGAWNTVVLTHANTTANWSISVNGSAPVNFTVTDTSDCPNATGNLGGWDFTNANDAPSTVFLSEVPAAPAPEPSAIVLVATGLIGLLAYAWRKRK